MTGFIRYHNILNRNLKNIQGQFSYPPQKLGEPPLSDLDLLLILRDTREYLRNILLILF